jgi:outer membrane beta-barrel protein
MDSLKVSHSSRHLLGSIKVSSAWALRLLICLLAVFWLTLIGVTWAEAADSANDEYNFNWLDTDKKIYVLQNRKYLKSGHPLLSVMGGIGFSNPYRSTFNIDPRFAYYFNESWGFEVFYTMSSNTPNNTIQALSIATTVLPGIREIRSQYGGMVHFVPWYAKINVFNSIIYFDWYFGVGAGQVSSFVTNVKNPTASDFVQQDLFSLFWATGHQYHVSQSFLIRMDVTSALYQAQINGTSGETSWYSNLNFGIGLGWKL